MLTSTIVSSGPTVQRMLNRHTSSTIFGMDTFSISVPQDSRIYSTAGQVRNNTCTYTSSGSPQCDSGCTVTTRQTQSHGMASTARDLKQSILCLQGCADEHVRHSGKQGDTDLCFTLPRQQGLGGRRPLHIVGWLRTDICIPSSSKRSPDSGKNQNVSRNDGESHRISGSVTAMAPTPVTTQCTNTHTTTGRGTVPVHSQPSHSQPSSASVPQRTKPVGSGRVAVISDILWQHNFPESVVDMAADPLRDSSSNVYNSQWKSFASWANTWGIATKDLSYVMLAEYFVHLFNQNKQVDTKVYRSAIASVLNILNPPTPLQEDTIHNLLCAMSIQRPRSQEILLKWHLSVVLEGLMKPPFNVHGSDKNIFLELLSYKTAFLVALATGARGSELVALSRADHNLNFSRLPSGARHVSIRLVPKYIPKNARLDTIPKPLEYPGISHLFSRDPERLLCPVRTLGLCTLSVHKSWLMKIQNRNCLCTSLLKPRCSPLISVAGWPELFASPRRTQNLTFLRIGLMRYERWQHWWHTTGIPLPVSCVDRSAGGPQMCSVPIISVTWLRTLISRNFKLWLLEPPYFDR